MNSETSINSQITQTNIVKPITNRKIYNRDDFFRIYSCTAEIPDYLKDFQYLYNNFYEDNWCRKPLPKFSEASETKGKSVYVNNKLKGRQRTLSNQSGEYTGEYHENYNKQRMYTGNGKYIRYGSVQNETDLTEDTKFDHNNKFINLNDFEDNPDSQWLKVESRTNRSFNASKPYSQNIQVTENHWKKWSKDSTSTVDKIHRPQNVPFNRSDKSNSIWLRKTENDGRQKNAKYYGRHSVSKSGDQTEDIWQDDWDTEMKSEIATADDLNLDSFELSKSSVLSSTPPPIVEPESQPIASVFEAQSNQKTPDHEMWFYRDLNDIERGPYSSENMANWLATGYFNPATFVRRMCDERFLLLAEYRYLYGRIPFTVGQTIPPIFRNTSIEIEPNQLLIGVENNFRPQVIQFATTLPHTPHNNVIRIEENVNISPNAILENKRLFDEGLAELERERERMVQEQLQWRARVEAEMEAKFNAKMEELMQRTLEANLVQTVKSPIDENMSNENLISEPEQSIVEVNEILDDIPQVKECDSTVPVSVECVASPVSDKLEIDDTEIPEITNTTDNNKWFSTKDIKNQKRNKKMKSKEAKNVKEEKQKVVPIPEAKPPVQPTDTKLIILPRESIVNAVSKETVTSSKIKPIRFEKENRKNEPAATWNATKNVVNSPTNVKSLAEIQAEESEKINQAKIPVDNEAVISKEKSSKKEPSISSKSFPVAQKTNNTKSFLEIQAEEAIKEKEVKELENISKIIETPTISNSIIAETAVSWKKTPLAVTTSVPPTTKSLLEIQAEEALKEKRNKELKTIAKANEMEANKITSFKDSLLKSTKVPQVPSGKSIWDMLPTEVPVNKTPVQKPESQVKQHVTNNIPKEIVVTKKENEQDHLTCWCLKKLSKFSDKFELNTVIELLKEVPNEEVMEMALQLLDDSKFTSSFVVEFINKRQELHDNEIGGDSWKTVKKSIPSPPITTSVSNNSKNKTAKSKSKKKMVVIETKFR